MTATAAIWLIGGLNTILVILILVVVSKGSTANKELSKGEIDKILGDSAQEVAQTTDQALKSLGDRLASQFIYLVDTHGKKTVSDFEVSLGQQTAAALDSYHQQLVSFREEADKIIKDNLSKITDDLGLTEKDLRGLIKSRQQTVIDRVEGEFAQIVESYVKQALVGSIDLAVQQDYIMDQLERLRPSLLEDLKHVGS